jgi:hypothetical protein
MQRVPCLLLCYHLFVILEIPEELNALGDEEAGDQH